MITVKDCEAFCDADPSWVHELACRECLTMVPAYAHAHEVMVCANDLAMPDHQDQKRTAETGFNHRLAA